MKIKFKSIQIGREDQENGIIEFSARVEITYEDGFTCLSFNENRNGKVIANRIEYNNNTLRIYSGITSLTCEYNKVVKNNFVADSTEVSQILYIYTKMDIMEISDENNLVFQYIVAGTEECNTGNEIRLEIAISE